MNNKNHSNLKPWQPGQSGNPAGRKPGSKNISTIVQELLDDEANANVLAQSSIAQLVHGASISYSKAVVLVAIQKALMGDLRAIIWLSEQQEHGSVQNDVERRPPIIVTDLKPRFSSTVD